MVLTYYLLRPMYGFCLDVMALLSVGPKLNRSGFVIDVFADPNDIIEEMLRIKVRILLEWNFCWLYTLDTVKCQIEKLQVILLGAKEKPAVTKFLQEIRTKDELCWFPRIK